LVPTIAIFLGFAAIAGALVAASGIVPIKASSGHWAVTTWLLEFSMRRSIATHSISVAQPRFEQPWMATKGAAHYDIGCAFCHGSPAEPEPRIPQYMLPHPPDLASVVSQWQPQELFYIVKHGIKFTGMPAWPAAARDDEVWAMVAFLLELPGLEEAAYRELARGQAAGGDAIRNGAPAELAGCVACHGRDGRGRGAGAFPALNGQSYAYLLGSLQSYAAKQRHSGIMAPVAAA
jgi:cytochrome c553